ncbi:hypothetical protein I2I05_00285 [Hymenobacter sp. BT683]|uniref:GLPGLI family protein n=1 Tax=Hymenobacter jeongseonensis TaxID=2791027 RepID=A0ABS0IBU1_9BACT|nr:hypothetical protein [Hymenobacter jeongseonensis]MBF9235821.1 hypothetical protein [Hymenobacter jeongseonensis]
MGPTAYAQRPPRVATHIDSLRAARSPALGDVYPATFTLVGGRRVSAFLTGIEPCYVERIECYERHPSQLPAPPLKALSIDRIEKMELAGHHYESLRLNGKLLGLMAESLTGAGPVALFGYYKVKNGFPIIIPLPLPGAAIFIPTEGHNKYFWYVRQPGGELLEVLRDSYSFAREMSVFFIGASEMAAQIKAKAPKHRFEDLPTLVQAYNARAAVK